MNHGQDSRLGKINCSYSVTRLLDGATLVCGGYDEDVINGGPCALASRLDPVSQQWTAVTDMPGGRAGHAAVLLSNGRLLVTGGRGYDGHHSTAWMYDPAADAWASVAEMPSKRIGHAAVLLPDGRVLVCGGDHGVGWAHSTAWAYDPLGDEWTAVAPMPGMRNGHHLVEEPFQSDFPHGLSDRADQIRDKRFASKAPRLFRFARAVDDNVVVRAGEAAVAHRVLHSLLTYSLSSRPVQSSASHRANKLRPCLKNSNVKS